MSKKLTSKQQKEQMNYLFAVYNKRLGRLYSDYIKRLLSLGYDEGVLDDDALFNYDNFPKLKARLNNIFNDYFQNSLLCYENGITDGVTLAYNHDKEDLGTFTILSNDALKVARATAAKTFIANRLHSKEGLNLAQTVWNYCQQSKGEFEMAMSNVLADGIKAGESAEQIGSKLRQYLNNPDMMYRRYHTVKVLKNGTKKDVVKWYKRKVINGKVRFVDEPLEAVGTGVYRSARKNALRVARTEINAAYLKAHNERWRKEPFVIGQWIHVSPEHDPEKHHDICDELQGRYPKDFVWLNWHPQCRCTSDPITLQGDEKKQFYKRLMAGEDMSNYVSPFAVTDVPDEFKQYIRDNTDANVTAGKSGKLAWHLRDNTKYWAGLLSTENRTQMGLNAISRKDEILEKAKARHIQRTQEQIDKIQSRWNNYRRNYYYGMAKDLLAGRSVTDIKSDALRKRYFAIRYVVADKKNSEEVMRVFNRFKQGYETKLTWTDRKVAMNVLKTAQKYGETDISNVQALLQAADYAKARAAAKTLAKQIKAIQLDEASLSKLIPDVNKWHKQFSSKELHGVYDAVESKLAQWQGLTLEKQASKLKFEAYDFLGNNWHGVQQKYTTWEVSQAAYVKKLGEVQDAIEWANIGTKLVDVKAYKTQSKVYHKLLYDLENAINAKDKALAQQLLSDTEAKKQQLINLKAKRGIKSNGSIPFDADAYSQARKDAAIWCKSSAESHNLFDAESNAFWNNVMTQKQRNGCKAYTGGSGHMNRPLRGYDRDWGWSNYKGVGNVPLNREYGEEHIKDLYQALERSTTKRDMWLQRGNERWAGVEGFFGVQNLSKADLQKFVGQEFTDWSFCSCGTAKGTGFNGTIFNIYCPKGTKAFYASPHSQFYSENETILQLGTRFRITKVEVTPYGNVYVDMEVVGYDKHPLL